MKSWMTICILCLNAIAVHANEAPMQADAMDPELRRELARRFRADQDVRVASMNWCNKHGIKEPSDVDNLGSEQKAEFEVLSTTFKEVDSDNTKWLKDVVEKRGWPTITLVGKVRWTPSVGQKLGLDKVG